MKIKFDIKVVIYGIVIVLFVLLGFIILPKIFVEDIKPVDYIVVQRDSIPDKILDMMDDYIDQERALATMIDGKVYVITTRGDHKDYGMEIEKINIENREGKEVMIVEVTYKKKEEAYPFVVAQTNLKNIPDKIELKTQFAEKNTRN